MADYLKYLYTNDVLKQAFKYVIENNKGWDNPYHNNQHTMDVFNNVMKLSYMYDLPKADRNILGVASLFHDFNHSGGKLKDDENIENAIKGLTKFGGEIIDIDEVADLILYTQFPSVTKPKTLSQQIIVDSDMMSIFEMTDWFNKVVVALSKEFNNTISKQLDVQLGFVQNMVLYTEYGKKLQEENTTGMLTEIQYLKTIFK